MTKIEIAVDAGNQVGESPIWDADEQALYWVDIIGKTINRFDPFTSVCKSWATKDFPTAIALLQRGGGAILAEAIGVSLFDFNNQPTPFATPDTMVGNRLNEGKCDPRGRFWVGSMQTNLNPDGSGKDITAHTGALFRVDPDGSNHRFSEHEFGIANTMAWSPDERFFYFGDTLRNVLFRYDYDADDGRVSNPSVFLERDDLGAPDGSCIDHDGCVWNARFGASILIRITPAGVIDRKVELPVTNPTSCTFGGADGRTLFVTSARFTLDEETLTANSKEGAVLALDVDISGPPDQRCAEQPG